MSAPESSSTTVHFTATLVLYQPAALGSVVGAPVTTGAVLSMLILSTVTLAVLPATSTTVPVMA